MYVSPCDHYIPWYNLCIQDAKLIFKWYYNEST